MSGEGAGSSLRNLSAGSEWRGSCVGSPPFLGVTAGVTQRNASHGSLKDGFKLFQGETRKNAFKKSGIHIKNAVIILHGFSNK